MEVVETILAIFYLLTGLGIIVLAGFYVYWLVKFLVKVPRELERIADALQTRNRESIKKGED